MEREDMQQVLDLMVAEPRGPEYSGIAALSRDIDDAPDDTLDDVRRKAARFRRLILSPRYRRKQRVPDAWCAAFIWPKRAGRRRSRPVHHHQDGAEAASRPRRRPRRWIRARHTCSATGGSASAG